MGILWLLLFPMSGTLLRALNEDSAELADKKRVAMCISLLNLSFVFVFHLGLQANVKMKASGH